MLRLVSGKYRGRKLSVPEGLSVRPTTERMRERVFSMLTHSRYPDLYEARVADLFAGSGALGLESLSRGACHVTFVEMTAAHAAIIRRNIELLKAEKDCTLLKGSATRLPTAPAPFDIIFMDPPYHQGLIREALDSLYAGGWTRSGSVIIAEMGSDEMVDIPDWLNVADERQQGKQKIQFLTVV